MPRMMDIINTAILAIRLRYATMRWDDDEMIDAIFAISERYRAPRYAAAAITPRRHYADDITDAA